MPHKIETRQLLKSNRKSNIKKKKEIFQKKKSKTQKPNLYTFLSPPTKQYQEFKPNKKRKLMEMHGFLKPRILYMRSRTGSAGYDQSWMGDAR